MKVFSKKMTDAIWGKLGNCVMMVAVGLLALSVTFVSCKNSGGGDEPERKPSPASTPAPEPIVIEKEVIVEVTPEEVFNFEGTAIEVYIVGDRNHYEFYDSGDCKYIEYETDNVLHNSRYTVTIDGKVLIGDKKYTLEIYDEYKDFGIIFYNLTEIE